MSSTLNSSLPSSIVSQESIIDSRALSPSSNVNLIENPFEQAKISDVEAEVLAEKRHSEFYFKDGNIIFSVEGTLYNVHQYFFQRDSSHFRATFEEHSMSPKEGVTDEYPFVLPDVKSSDFDEFLSILYPTDFRRPYNKSTAQWASILHLAVRWGFETIKLLCIDHLTSTANPIDKIVLGRRYNITEWLASAYEAVCTRADALTMQEGLQLGMKDTIRISAVRQAYGSAAARYERSLLSLDLGEIFSLPSDTEEGEAVHEEAVAMKDLEAQIAQMSADSKAESGSDTLVSTEYPCQSPVRTKTSKGQRNVTRCGMCLTCQGGKPESAEERSKRDHKAAKELQFKELQEKQKERERQRLKRNGRVSFFEAMFLH